MDSMEGFDEEDYKQIRKLRKVLRQIEHLQILTRELNPEEKLKVSKRTLYRQELFDLNAKYAHLMLDMSANTTSDVQTESSFDESSSPRRTAPTQVVEDITEKFESLNLTEQETPEKRVVVDEKKQLQEQPPSVSAVKVDVKKVEVKKSPVKQEPKKTPLASLVRFTTLETENAHEDLITCLDTCTENSLLATGSRDTTIKVWDLENGKLLHSFGGHTSAVTCIRFWPVSSYKKCLENILNTTSEDEPEYDETKQFLDEINESERITDDEQLVLSSSLDCSFRIWSVSESKCLRQFYLYNCINKFDVNDLAIAFALDAGKIEYWNNILQKCTLKAFDDTESVREIQFSENLICALTSTGSFKIYMCTNGTEPALNLLKENKISNLPIDRRSLFKHFVMLNDHQILLTNGQSYLVSQDLIKSENKLIPNNSNEYGMSTCLSKIDSFVYSSAYDIDRGISTVNVFSSNNDKLTYEYTFEDKSNATNYCISSISVKNVQNKQTASTVFVTGSDKSFKIWKVWNENNSKSATMTSGQRVKYAKLVNASNTNLDSHDDETDQENEESEHEDENETREDETTEQKKSNCNLQ